MYKKKSKDKKSTHHRREGQGRSVVARPRQQHLRESLRLPITEKQFLVVKTFHMLQQNLHENAVCIVSVLVCVIRT